jgi:hypothetical protein
MEVFCWEDIFSLKNRLGMLMFSFSYRVAHNWNSLPTDVKFSKNINICKNSLDSIPKFVEQFYGVD